MSDTWSSIQAHKKQLDSLRERLQRRRKQDSGHLGEVRGGPGGPGRGERLLERKTAPGSAPFPEQPFIGLLDCWLPHLSRVAETHAHLRESLQCLLPGVGFSSVTPHQHGAPLLSLCPIPALGERCVCEASQYPIPRASKTRFVASMPVLP